ncbi:MAG: M48 family metalloprotease [Pseudomonadota bacterium]
MHLLTSRRARLTLVALLAALAGCATNPVTGKSELRLVSTAQQIQQGEQNYAPLLQSQGGALVVDDDLQSYVNGVGQRLAVVSDLRLPYEFTVLNNSVPNAWALPGGKIAINRGLLTELNSEAELAAVLGHEIVHAAAGHSAQAQTRALILQGGILATAIAASDSDYANIWLAGASVGAQLINQRYSRGAELESDRYGMEYMVAAGYDPQGAVDLQETFVRLSAGRQSDWLSGLFASHPPSQERVAANRATAAALGASGIAGRDTYQRAMANMIAAKPAYEAYDDGRKALSNDDIATAARLGRQAVEMLPGEAHFHALLGDVELKRKNYDAAVGHYDRAIGRNDAFFYYYLQRGLIAEEQRRDDSARLDLERSVALLPTGPAYFALGNIARRQNRPDVALAYYERARGSQGQLGIAAETAVLEMDLPSNPGKYLRSRSGLDENGQLLVEVANATRVPLTGIAVAIVYIDENGRQRSVSRRVRGVLDAGKAVRVGTGLGPFTSSGQYRVNVSAARMAN